MSRRRRENIEDYERSLKAGYGVGRGLDYKPWIRVRDVPSRGVSGKNRSVTVGRLHQTLSELETRVFVLADFDRHVIDIREQFPIFPLDAVVQLASNAGLAYPTIPRSTVPAVLTTDFLLTRSIGGEISYLAISVKPSAELRKHRILEKLEIERLWWESLGIQWKLATEMNVSCVVADNLMWISRYLRGEDEVFPTDCLPSLEPLVKAITPRTYTIESLMADSASALGCGIDLAEYVILKAIWEKRLSIDLHSAIEHTGLIDLVGWDLNMYTMESQFTNERSA